MPPARRHHFLPQTYLEQFCRDGSFFLYDCQRQQSRLQTPKNTAVKRDYYTVVFGSGDRDPGLETLLSEVESSYADLVDRIHERGEITFDEKQSLALFVAFMYTRVPRYERDYDKAAERVLKNKLRTTLPNPEAIAAYVRAHPQIAARHPNLDPNKVDAFLRGERYRVQVPRAYSIVSGVRSVIELAPRLALLEWRFALAPSGKAFVTCDDPILFIQPGTHSRLRNHFPYLQGLNSLMPLSHRLCLLVAAPGPLLGTGTIEEAVVHEINRAVASQASEFLIARDRAQLNRFLRNVPRG